MSSFAKSAATALLSGVVGRYQAMLKIEFDRAKAEVEGKLKQIGIGSALVATAAMLGFFAVPLLLTAAVAGLSVVWPVWLSALALGVVVLLIMAILAGVGVSKIKKNKDLTPTESVENVKKMFNWG
ncbi:phage holin family protein [Demequina capsici]|uniref:Phage holin family protein n=1 Tax=Demequina capsici TaxID=3075620 RepID=A0AA96F7T6_9MICO|nr:phage holin family protein [Demequina sp. OYTSA14]WNM24773.1 phage holin family protein [Demequina sp. OYTSA14]